MKDHFYVTLPSNSSHAYYGSQPTHHYRTRLHAPVKLPAEEWEVGLAEFAYPRSCACLPNGNFKVYGPTTPGGTTTHYFGTVPDLRYDSPASLVDAVNSKLCEVSRASSNSARVENKISLDLLPDRRCKARFQRTKTTCWCFQASCPTLWASVMKRRCICVEVIASRGSLKQKKAVCLLGDPEDIIIKSPFAVKVDRLVSDLYLYADIVEPQLIGDFLVPLFRTVADTSTSSGEIVTADFRQIHYIPLTTWFFESIDIRIADMVGRPVRFLFGEITVKLHFRRGLHS